MASELRELLKTAQQICICGERGPSEGLRDHLETHSPAELTTWIMKLLRRKKGRR